MDIGLLLQSLLPSPAATHVLLRPALVPPLLSEEQDLVTGAVDKRIDEVTCGRFCARQALHKLDVPPVPILRGPNREPLWPTGIVGSITHCDGLAAAAVAPQSELRSLGIDAEPHAPLPKGVLDQISLPDERRSIACLSDSVHWDRLLFCAKEAIYKAWFPLRKQWLGFQDVLITVDPDSPQFKVSSLRYDIPPLPNWSCKYAVAQGFILTAVYSSPN